MIQLIIVINLIYHSDNTKIIDDFEEKIAQQYKHNERLNENNQVNKCNNALFGDFDSESPSFSKIYF